jgi:hypothetical protein
MRSCKASPKLRGVLVLERSPMCGSSAFLGVGPCHRPAASPEGAPFHPSAASNQPNATELHLQVSDLNLPAEFGRSSIGHCSATVAGRGTTRRCRPPHKNTGNQACHAGLSSDGPLDPRALLCQWLCSASRSTHACRPDRFPSTGGELLEVGAAIDELCSTSPWWRSTVSGRRTSGFCGRRGLEDDRHDGGDGHQRRYRDGD